MRKLLTATLLAAALTVGTAGIAYASDEKPKKVCTNEGSIAVAHCVDLSEVVVVDEVVDDVTVVVADLVDDLL